MNCYCLLDLGPDAGCPKSCNCPPQDWWVKDMNTPAAEVPLWGWIQVHGGRSRLLRFITGILTRLEELG